jgi:hypothetical protein
MRREVSFVPQERCSQPDFDRSVQNLNKRHTRPHGTGNSSKIFCTIVSLVLSSASAS